MLKSVIFLFLLISISCNAGTNFVKNDIVDMNLTISDEANISYINDINNTATELLTTFSDIVKAKEKITDVELPRYINDDNLQSIVAQSSFFTFTYALGTMLNFKEPPFSIVYKEFLARSFDKNSKCKEDVTTCFRDINNLIQKDDFSALLQFIEDKPGVKTFAKEIKLRGYQLPLIVEITLTIKDKRGNIVDTKSDFFNVIDLARLNKIADDSGIVDVQTKKEAIFILTNQKLAPKVNSFVSQDFLFDVENFLSYNSNNLLSVVYKNTNLNLFIKIPFEFNRNTLNSFKKMNEPIIESDYFYDISVREVYIKSEAISQSKEKQ